MKALVNKRGKLKASDHTEIGDFDLKLYPSAVLLLFCLKNFDIQKACFQQVKDKVKKRSKKGLKKLE
ncbi:hypothetical protein [Flavobacterium sinopsychrotolerans]|uniref:hypothetical protein n=1 Tax=Flavobacterium sinopsychrotolerans TaxID=604089 RepID=UPI00115FAB49|nr:hypothetical protein [Flavobacterium sinopsychrotolerans]